MNETTNAGKVILTESSVGSSGPCNLRAGPVHRKINKENYIIFNVTSLFCTTFNVNCRTLFTGLSCKYFAG